MMNKVDELHEKLDKIDKAKHASKRGGAGKVNLSQMPRARQGRRETLM